jgi:hypothetical protein
MLTPAALWVATDLVRVYPPVLGPAPTSVLMSYGMALYSEMYILC